MRYFISLFLTLFTMSVSALEIQYSYEDFFVPFEVERSFIGKRNWCNFKIGDITVAKGDLNFNTFELKSPTGAIITTATKYTLLPSRETIFDIRDSENNVKGYLKVHNSQSFFSIVKGTTLYNALGEPLIETPFSTANPFDTKGRTPFNRIVLESSRKITLIPPTGNVFVEVVYPEYLLENIDIELFLTYLQMHVSNSTLCNSYLLSSEGEIYFDDLSNIPHYSDEIIVTNDYGTGAIKAWKRLKEKIKKKIKEKFKEQIEKINANADLSDEDYEAICTKLADKFEAKDGSVDAEKILKALDELTDEEKSVILEKIEAIIE